MTEFGGDAFKIVSSGQPVKHSARRENLLSAMASEHQAGRGVGMSNPRQIGSRPVGQVQIKNNTASTVAKFGVLCVDGVQINHTENPEFFENDMLLSGIEPALTHLGKFVVTTEPINPGEIGRGFIDGVFPAKVDIVTEGDGFCDVKDGDTTQLQSGPRGAAQILYAEAGIGTKWCIIRMGSNAAGALIGRFDDAYTAGGVYEGFLTIKASGDVPAGANVTGSDLGADGEAILIVNLKELDAGTHTIMDPANTTDVYAQLTYLWTNADGMKTYVCDKIFIGCEEAEEEDVEDW